MRFDYLSFKVWSSKTETPGFKLEGDDWLSSFEPEDRYDANIEIDIFGEVFDLDKDRSVKKNIGFIYGIIFDVESAYDDGEDIHDIFDSHSADALALYESLKGDEGDLNFEYVGLGTNVFYIDFIYIEEKYRCKELGAKVLEMLEDLIKYSLNYKIGCIALIAIAMDKSKNKGYRYDIVDNPELKNKVKKFFINSSYRTIPGTEFMFRNTDYKPKKLIIV